ncbi:hypothetical protein GCM10010885_24110 [Alicyclobacillus cellulosilyticus]|uniref:GDT1 family protein n=1 Tax=Alicyclobacillus cellulosilyticus TaxID=1003997 RepID=A0A917NPW3_9BACL|nr:hypothetical protein GCM10010885_24110 [Alicyclobacillus cellulosilyticus]
MNGYVFLGSFLGTAVEFVEALTIVLAVGVVKGWRNAMAGTLLALFCLAVLIGVFGPLLLAYVPLAVMQVVLGGFLLLFGLRWLRKAVLRYAGYKALHDEDEAYAKEIARQERQSVRRGAWDVFGVATAWNGVFLEGLEAAFIILTMGLTGRAMGSAVAGGIAAVAAVVLAGVLLRKPLQFVPENTVKFIVGVMLSSFGTLWVGEGAGATWWHSDVSVLVLLAVYLAASGCAVGLLRRARAASG